MVGQNSVSLNKSRATLKIAETLGNLFLECDILTSFAANVPDGHPTAFSRTRRTTGLNSSLEGNSPRICVDRIIPGVMAMQESSDTGEIGVQQWGYCQVMPTFRFLFEGRPFDSEI